MIDRTAALAFGFVCPFIGGPATLKALDWELLEEYYPSIDSAWTGDSEESSSHVVFVGSSLLLAGDVVEFNPSKLRVANVEIDELSLMKEKMGFLYAEHGYEGEEYTFSPVGWQLFGIIN